MMVTGGSPGWGGTCLPIPGGFGVGQAHPLLWSEDKSGGQLGEKHYGGFYQAGT